MTPTSRLGSHSSVSNGLQQDTMCNRTRVAKRADAADAFFWIDDEARGDEALDGNSPLSPSIGTGNSCSANKLSLRRERSVPFSMSSWTL